MNQTYTYIDTSEDLEKFCTLAKPKLMAGDFLTLDTEFIRERTYAPQLCLIQIATAEDSAIVDPLAKDIKLAPLLDLLANPDIKKVFHAGRQDLEIFLNLMGELPQNLFDTQIAAMVCGFGDSVGYETLVKKITQQSIDKSVRFSNWAHRPLTKKQLDYAIGDVTHLRPVYEFLQQEIIKNNREPWIAEEISILLNPKTYEPDEKRLFFKLKLRTSKPHALARALYLIRWREEKAVKDDKPRQTIMRDELIAELAIQYPQTINDFRKIRGLRDQHHVPKTGDSIIEILHQASSLPLDECPQLPLPVNESAIDPLSQDLLRLLLKYISNKEGVAEKIIATSKDMTFLMRHGNKADLSCLKGWRYDVFGKIALDLMEGKLSLSLNNGHVLVSPKEI